MQLPLVQSEGIEQVLPEAQAPHSLPLLRPPQSMSLSAPSFTPFPHGLHLLLRQPLLWQSVGALQARPSAQVGQTPPPQFNAVSGGSVDRLAQVAG